jgi:antitoxin component YwqK of YwqJK toxin-antitoxin module
MFRSLYTILIMSVTLLWSVSLSTFAQAGGLMAADTLNQMDEAGRKNGWWRITAPVQDKPGYADGALIEEGGYVNNKRAGIWRRYWPNGKVMSEITYVNGRPRGEYKTWYPNGRMEEQGNWDLDRNTGRFQRWHPNGKLAQDFVFNEHGQRDGDQKYYHENGQLAVQVHVKEGREEGTLKRYTSSGDLLQVAEFNGGVINEANSRYIKPVPKAADIQIDAAAPPAPEVTKKETTNAVVFRANGYNTMYDEQMRLSQHGEYRNGRLFDGRRYLYDEHGLLLRIQVYKGGRYAGDAIITSEDRGY